jgi:hypothetical protein
MITPCRELVGREISFVPSGPRGTESLPPISIDGTKLTASFEEPELYFGRRGQ